MHAGFMHACVVSLCPTNLKDYFYKDFTFVQGMRLSGRSHPTALSNTSLYVLISYKCFEVIFPEKESVAVISSAYKVQQYASVKTGTVTRQISELCIYVMKISVTAS